MCGMTETSPVSTQTLTDDSIERRVSANGRAGPHLVVKIVNAVTGNPAPCNAAGELCISGYAVGFGYWGQTDKTAEAALSWGRPSERAIKQGPGEVAGGSVLGGAGAQAIHDEVQDPGQSGLPFCVGVELPQARDSEKEVVRGDSRADRAGLLCGAQQ